MALLTADEIIEVAIRLEKDGQAFYSRAASAASTPRVRALFEDLAKQELAHQRAFERLDPGTARGALSPMEWEEFQAYTQVLLQQRLFDAPGSALRDVSHAPGEEAALQAALGFEKDTLLFFHELRAAVGGRGDQVIEQIIMEEKRHIRRLASMSSTS